MVRTADSGKGKIKSEKLLKKAGKPKHGKKYDSSEKNLHNAEREVVYPQVTYEQFNIKESLKFKDTDVLHINIKYPKVICREKGRKIERMNHFFRKLAGNLIFYSKKNLYNRAASDFLNSIKKPAENEIMPEETIQPFKAYGVVLSFEVTYNRQGIFCIYFDVNIYAGKGRGKIVRRVYIWDMEKVIFVPPSAFITFRAANKKKIAEYIIKIMTIQTEKGEEYYTNADFSHIYKSVRQKNLFLTDKGYAVFFPQGFIAGEQCGIIHFIIPEKIFNGE